MDRKIRSLLLVSLLAGLAVAARSATARPDSDEGASTGAHEATTAFLEGELRSRYGDLGGELRYLDGSTDLDGDGHPELFVYVVGPMVCGSGGCNTLVFTPDGEGFRQVAEISVSRTPIQALERRSNGWRNLLVHVSGGGILPGYDAELRFDGLEYPSNPTVPPAEKALNTAGAEIVIPDFESFTDAKLLGAASPDASGETDSEGTSSTAASELAGTAWRLVEIQSMDDTVRRPTDRALYTLELGKDGTAVVQADCNRATGPWSSESAGQLAFGLMAATQAMCGPGSLHDVYLRQFGWVRSYVLQDGHLFLATMADGSILEFERIVD